MDAPKDPLVWLFDITCNWKSNELSKCYVVVVETQQALDTWVSMLLDVSLVAWSLHEWLNIVPEDLGSLFE